MGNFVYLQSMVRIIPSGLRQLFPVLACLAALAAGAAAATIPARSKIILSFPVRSAGGALPDTKSRYFINSFTSAVSGRYSLVSTSSVQQDSLYRFFQDLRSRRGGANTPPAPGSPDYILFVDYISNNAIREEPYIRVEPDEIGDPVRKSEKKYAQPPNTVLKHATAVKLFIYQVSAGRIIDSLSRQVKKDDNREECDQCLIKNAEKISQAFLKELAD
jgi:hypothetical protein